MPVIVRTLFPPAIYEAGRLEAIDLMIATLLDIILALKEEVCPIGYAARQEAIADIEQQIAELSVYRTEAGAEIGEPQQRHLE
jgi:hypothetical protein